MIPTNSLVTPPILAPLLYPLPLLSTDTMDYAWGGIGISDPSQGLLYQIWTLEVRDANLSTSSVWLSSPNTSPFLFVSLGKISRARLTFDQNMKPAVTLTTNLGSYLYWWDPTIPGQVFLTITPGSLYPCCILDDPRPISVNLGGTDVLVFYIRTNTLYMLRQRDRYTVEYTLQINLNLIISNPLLYRVGMNTLERLQFELQGQLYQ